ncbi:NAD kinase [Desertibacillus haloalkaliphilus]|uniref:NAD kinase n=1 Tax=Desertibacillus haloalkaliphilus TaxID=1328930 RepID=UPI001C276BF1|nr:NAD kinase [Desertibacillus haloalkaliphilus]MBU8905194.1 NAD kinase [Desertibacillus haloalkaliphilus]
MQNRKQLYFSHKQTPELAKVVEPLKERAEKEGFTIVSNYRQADIIASIGGDNAFLQAIQKTEFKEDSLYVGISLDNLGFYTDFHINDTDHLMSSIANDEVEVRRYHTLEVTLDNESPFYCLNECSLRSNVIKTFVIDVYIDDTYFETFRGDGMIVSTPSGSTGYNKSVRGAIVDPRIPSMQVSEIASINNNDYRTLGTSFILSEDRQLKLKIVQDGNDHPIIGTDNEALSIRHAHELRIRLADKNIKVLKLKNNSFWDSIQRKFL